MCILFGQICICLNLKLFAVNYMNPQYLFRVVCTRFIPVLIKDKLGLLYIFCLFERDRWVRFYEAGQHVQILFGQICICLKQIWLTP